MKYIHLPKGSSPPSLQLDVPYKAIVIIDEVGIDATWQREISRWMVETGCRYMMAWGHDCSSWDDSVDYANLEMFGFKDIPDDKLVMTTWHDNEAMDHVFWFCENCARRDGLGATETIIIDITAADRREAMRNRFVAARRFDASEPMG